MIVADLHIHSPYSRATAKAMLPEHLWMAAQLKGIDLLGTGDFTHPAWFEILREKLIETGDGAYALRPEVAAAVQDQIPATCHRPVRFIPSGEISSIYKRGGKTRKVHSLILMPTLEDVARLNQRLDRLGNIKSDGRPILGLDAKDLLELCLEVCPEVIFIPAHIWTPWFSVFGSKSGFDSLEECFGELTGHIHALETGLSSDPPMNWRLSALDRFTLVSNSDAHSPAKLAREANLLDCPPTYHDLARALELGPAGGFGGTIEFFPDEGKYHLDGHRKCNLRLSPAETKQYGGRCPVCGGLITVGVLSRVEDLADRPEGVRPQGAADFQCLVPLNEVAAEVAGRGPATKGVQAAVAAMRAKLGPDLEILRNTPLEDLERLAGPVMAEAVRRVRAGQVRPIGGYDGEFGVIKVFTEQERAEFAGQKALLDLGGASRAPRKKKDPSLPLTPKADPVQKPEPSKNDSGFLNPEQQAAVDYRGGHLIVRAGPGSGKTRMLVARAGALAHGAGGGDLLMITFTRKAAEEMRQRLAQTGAAGRATVSTFHALGLGILGDRPGQGPELIDPDERQALLKRIAKEHDLRQADVELAISRAKQRLDARPEAEYIDAWRAYHQALDGRLDLDDLVLRAVEALDRDAALSDKWSSRFAHVLVDEYQDVNPVQVELLRKISASAEVTAIGDPDQAIYGFRGAERALFDSFEMTFTGAAALTLGRNYRNAEPVLASAGALMRAEREAQAMAAMAGPGPLITCREAADPMAEARWIAGQVVDLLGGLDSRQVEGGADAKGKGYGAADIAVLYRLHAQAGLIAEALSEAGVPLQVAADRPLAELDPLDLRAQRVSLLSMHAAKGLEFPVVFIAGLESGLLPYEPPNKPPAEAAEERRLLYVAMTRAKRRLYFSRAMRRTLFGKSYAPERSPFWADLPADMLSYATTTRKAKARQLKLF